MANKDLFEQAIADAKKLREISLQQAKQKMEETFAPKIQEMFRLKLSEMEDLDEAGLEEEGYEMDESGNETFNVKRPEYMQGDQVDTGLEDPNPLDEMSLDEILAELELEEGDDMEENYDMEEEGEDLYESNHVKADGYNGPLKDKKEAHSDRARGADHAYSGKGVSSIKEAGKKKGAEVEKAEEKEEKGSDEVAELSIEEFKDLIRDVVADVMGKEAGAEEEEAEDLEGGEEMGGEDLEGGKGVEGEEEETISLDEILADMDENYQNAPKDKFGPKDGFVKKAKFQVREDESEELEEAISTIQTLKSQLSEINLLNAKLLYVNKLYKAKNLNEGQKVKVLVAFDRATTIKEAKNIYATLQDSIQSTPTTAKSKGYIKESLGFASKPIGSAPAKPIVEADAYVYRMQQLAGLKQPNI
jgi:hypothetical protein